MSDEKVKKALETYNLGMRDMIDFNSFYDFSQMVSKAPEETELSSEDKEYCIVKNKLVNAFVALGGDKRKKGKIMKQKLASVLLEDFELTLDLEVTL